MLSLPVDDDQPLHDLIAKIRQPATLRELMAACLRSAYMGDPFTGDKSAIPANPAYLMEAVTVSENIDSGIRCCIYRPTKQDGPLPAMLYMHGGGFVIGCSEDTDYITRMLCHTNQTVVISINYRLAPEVVFPGALDDCQKVLDWVTTHSNLLDVNSNCIYLAGDSAGANLAAALAQTNKATKGLVMLAPWLDMAVESYQSYNRLAPRGIVFDAAFLGYARAAYVGYENWKNPLVSPIHAPIKDLPPTLVLIGEEDPFVDQVRLLDKLAKEGGFGHVKTLTYTGMPHCYYSFPDLYKEERETFKTIARFLKR